MIPVVSRDGARAFDQQAISSGVPSIVLMENAGRGAADVIVRSLLADQPVGRRVVVVAGTGNNGGDGFVVARHLLRQGADVAVWFVGDAKKQTPDCKAMHAAYTGVGGKLVKGLPSSSHLDVVVDALFGTGLSREITGALVKVVDAINAADAPVVALDVPSGLDTDTGVALGPCVEATLTVTFGQLKLGHVTGSGAVLSGPVHVVDIGVPAKLPNAPDAHLADAADVRAVLKRRAVDTHKYRAGHAVLFAGSPGKSGAALLAARGALRGGAGAATVVTWPEAAHVLESKIPEVMVQPLDPSPAWLDDVLAKKKAALIGPGFGHDAKAVDVARHVLKHFDGAIVCDADSFSMFAGEPSAFAKAKKTPILTPHAGELGRLLSVEDIEEDRFTYAKAAAKAAKSVVLLKGAYTVVADPKGRVVVTGSGTPALATAGSGDVLAGLVTALACTLDPFDAAWVGAYLHGVAGAAWSKEHGDRGVLAHEIANELPGVMGALLSGRAAV